MSAKTMEFSEFISELISVVNLPITILMAMVILYWLMVIVGVLGMDAIDLDLDVDADFDLDPGVEAAGDGVFGGVLAFMHLGEVPVMILGSIVIFVLWMLTVASNMAWNVGHNIWLSLGLAIPNFVISCLVAKGVIWPFLNVFKTDQTLVETRANMIGEKGTVTTSQVNEKFGQVEIQIDGPAIVINARTVAGEELAKGDCAKIVAYNSANDTFTVSLSKWEKK